MLVKTNRVSYRVSVGIVLTMSDIDWSNIRLSQSANQCEIQQMSVYIQAALEYCGRTGFPLPHRSLLIKLALEVHIIYQYIYM